MKLVKFRVTNFRSIEDSGEITLDSVLCLAGKNEAGKTAVMSALAGLNPHPSTPVEFRRERDYPRRYFLDYKKRHPDKEAVVIESHWLLETEDKQALANYLGPNVVKGDMVKVSRRYGAELPEWEIKPQLSLIIDFLFNDEGFNAVERKGLGEIKTTDALRNALEAMPNPTEKHGRLLARLNRLPRKNATLTIEHILRSRLPRFMMFSHYDRMEGQIRLDTWPTRVAKQDPTITEGERVFIDFLEYAGTSVKEILTATTYEALNAQCEAASNAISEELAKSWTQNPNLEIEVRVTQGEANDIPPFNEGVIARARVKNTLHRISIPFSERSAGFVWFFSFLVKFARVQSYGEPMMILLDEPGLTLHGKAQADLMSYIYDRLAPEFQVIFSTHSPFMIMAERIQDVRIVEDTRYSDAERARLIREQGAVHEGTQVYADFDQVDETSLLPLQIAFSHNLTASMMAAPYSLLVNHPSDMILLEVWSEALRRRRRGGLDRRWAVIPAGGIENISQFLRLYPGGSESGQIMACLVGGERHWDAVATPHSVNISEMLDRIQSRLEDVFVPEFYLNLVLAAMGDQAPMAEACLVQLAEQPEFHSQRDQPIPHLITTALASAGLPASLYHPAQLAWFVLHHPEYLDQDNEAVNATLDRAEHIIAALNGFLPKPLPKRGKTMIPTPQPTAVINSDEEEYSE